MDSFVADLPFDAKFTLVPVTDACQFILFSGLDIFD
jgi:hypothetical protein